MKKGVIFFAGLACLAFIVATKMTLKNSLDLETKLDNVLSGFGYTDREIAGLVALKIKNGDIVARYSKKNPTIQSNQSYSVDTKFRIASISKLVTALGAMQLVEQGKLDLDADISQYLGFTLRNPHFPDIKITTRMLLSHTSGILDGQVYSIPPNESLRSFFEPDGKYWEEGAHFADKQAQNGFPLGSFFQYSNLGFGVLGTVMENVSEQRFDLYMDEQIFKPLNIDAGFNVRLMSEGFNLIAPIYRKLEGQWVVQVDDYQGERLGNTIQVENPDTQGGTSSIKFNLTDYKVGTNGTFFSPQGGLRISANDLSKIAIMLMNDGVYQNTQILQPETIAKMESVQWTHNGKQGKASNGDTYFGLMQEYGLSIHNLKGNSAGGGSDIPFLGYKGGLKGHSGEAYGLLSGLYYDEETHEGFIYFITGTPELSKNYGEYSSFYRWEEAILTALSSH